MSSVLAFTGASRRAAHGKAQRWALWACASLLACAFLVVLRYVEIRKKRRGAGSSSRCSR